MPVGRRRSHTFQTRSEFVLTWYEHKDVVWFSTHDGDLHNLFADRFMYAIRNGLCSMCFRTLHKMVDKELLILRDDANGNS